MKKPNLPDIEIHVPTTGNELLVKALNNINHDKHIYTLWRVVNINAVDRLNMTDHGPVHVQIVANISLRLMRMLTENKVVMSLTTDYGLSQKHAELVVVLGGLLHDLGMSISREGHEEYSLFLANNLLYKILDFLPIEEQTIIASEVLHTIISHRSGGHPLTIEAGIVRVADALDMSKGRSRIPYEKGEMNIYSISASAVENIKILKGKDKPIQINISMNNSAGIFQVDELLKKKIAHSGIEKYISVHACISQNKEKKLLSEYNI
jgi:hypothetical protein